MLLWTTTGFKSGEYFTVQELRRGTWVSLYEFMDFTSKGSFETDVLTTGTYTYRLLAKRLSPGTPLWSSNAVTIKAVSPNTAGYVRPLATNFSCQAIRRSATKWTYVASWRLTGGKGWKPLATSATLNITYSTATGPVYPSGQYLNAGVRKADGRIDYWHIGLLAYGGYGKNGSNPRASCAVAR